MYCSSAKLTRFQTLGTHKIARLLVANELHEVLVVMKVRCFQSLFTDRMFSLKRESLNGKKQWCHLCHGLYRKWLMHRPCSQDNGTLKAVEEYSIS